MKLFVFLLYLQFSSNDCLTCHSDEIKGTVHKKVECSNCHKGIKDLPHKTPLPKVKCESCHRDIFEKFREDIHYKLQKKGVKRTPDCPLCHGKHKIYPVESPKTKISPLNIEKFCSECHKEIIPPRVYHFTIFPSSQCVECHGEIEIVQLRESVHKNLTCNHCHRGIKELPHEEESAIPECNFCHKSEYLEHKESIHGTAIAEGIADAAHCWDCHGSHLVLDTEDKRAMVSPRNLPETCGKCHGKAELAEKYKIPIKNPFQLYEQSVHHYALLEGKRAATCSECHGVHNIQPSTHLESPINKSNLPITCSKCHKKEYQEYVESIHWKGYLRGVKESPVCSDCHSEHRILPPESPESPVYPLNIPRTCSDCHERYILTQRYGIPAMRLSTFYQSYHGVALKARNLIAANCASCHQNHKILPSRDPLSPIHPDNLPKTCGACHPGIKPTAEILSVHKVISPVGSFVIDLVRKIYIYLILITIGGMVIFCFLDFIKKAREGVRLHNQIGEEVLRFNTFERTLHLLHLISFIILVYTGFIHHYPEAIWGAWLAKILGGSVRSYLHRIAGVIMLIVFLIHIFLIIWTRRGRKQFFELLIKLKDIKDAILLLLYNLGIKKEKPLYGRFTFYEKFEYWALNWGTVVMGLTGIALWFETQTLNILQKWFIDLFIVIHFYEAILASLAILIWHLYWVIFDPAIYPLNSSMFTGKMKEKI